MQLINKKSNKAWWFLLIIILIIAGILIWWFLMNKEVEEEVELEAEIEDEVEEVEYTLDNMATVMLSQPIESLVDDIEPDMSHWAVKDKKGLIYYARNSDKKKRIMVVDADGVEHEKWSSGSAEASVNIELVGNDQYRVIFIFTDKQEPMTCLDLWAGEYVYYGIGYGTDSFSGASGLLLENDQELLQEMQSNCE